MTRPRPNRPRDPNAIQMKGWLNPIWYDVAYSVNALLETQGRHLTSLQHDIQSVLAARLPATACSVAEIDGRNLTTKGSTADAGHLPATGVQRGDIWLVTDTDHAWEWNGTRWIDLGLPRFWAVERFEQELGLEVNPPGVSLTDRCSRVEARFLGIGSTVYQLRQIARAWGYGDIAVLPGVEDWTVYAQFIDTYGIPTDLVGHESELRNNIQGHLNGVFLFHFLLWNELLPDSGACSGLGIHWCQVKAAEVTWDQLKVTPQPNLPCDIDCNDFPDSLDPDKPLYGPEPTPNTPFSASVFGWMSTNASMDLSPDAPPGTRIMSVSVSIGNGSMQTGTISIDLGVGLPISGPVSVSTPWTADYTSVGGLPALGTIVADRGTFLLAPPTMFNVELMGFSP
jgi:hypothetical protein